MAAMSIAELARSAGVGVETVRYYQRRGLMADPRPQRTGATGIRHYGPEDSRRLRFVRTAQNAGFTLEEIAELLRLDASEDRARARAMARSRLAELDARIAALRQARKALARLADECASGDKGPCPIIASFEGRGSAVTLGSRTGPVRGVLPTAIPEPRRQREAR